MNVHRHKLYIIKITQRIIWNLAGNYND